MRSLLFLAAFAACEPPDSDHPLSDPAAAKADPRLSGRFSGKVQDADVVVFLARGQGATIDLVMVVHEKEKGAFDLHWQAFPSTIGGKNYLNLQRKMYTNRYSENFDLSPTYIFARYEIKKDGSLTLWQMQEKLVKEAIADKALEGEVKEDNAKLHAPTARLAAFVEKADPAKLFELFGTFKRL
jgi:hypothetical protein